MEDVRTTNETASADRDLGPTRSGYDRDAPLASSDEQLLPPDAASAYSSRWEEIQSGFVDDPRSAVEQADALVQEVVGRITSGFARTRESLEAAWAKGDDASTEDLRVSLQAYRTFFGRLLDT